MGAKGIKEDKQTSERWKVRSDGREGVSRYLEQARAMNTVSNG